LASASTELRGRDGPVGASAVEVRRRRHLATVFGFSPQRAASRPLRALELGSNAASFWLSREDLPP
jgi:hypothetical protein